MTTERPYAATKVLQIDELSVHIFSCLENDWDKIPFALTCTSLFQLLIPFLWSHVSGIERLFATIPGVQIDRDVFSCRVSIVNQYSWSADLLILLKLIVPVLQTLPELLHTDTLSRFYKYCSLVKNLEVSRSESWSLEFPHSERINALVLPDQSLFPNLLSLSSPVWDHEPESALLNWLSESISSSLEALRITHERDFGPGRILVLQARDRMVNTVAQRSPNLQSLGLLVSPQLSYDSVDDFSEDPRDWHSYLPYVSGMTNIRDLSISPVYLQAKGIEVFGGLPLLETLTIDFSGEDSLLTNRDIEPHMFPALRHLVIRNLPSPADLAHIWSLSRMVDRLNSLDITSRFSRSEYAARFVDEGRTIQKSVLSARDSQIRSLSVGQAWGSHPWISDANFIIFLRSVSGLPLRVLEIYVQDDNRFYITDTLDQLRLTAFPHLLRLELSNIRVSFDSLYVFSQCMPCLEYLQAPIDISSIISISSLDHVFANPGSLAMLGLEVDLWGHPVNVLNTRLFIDQLDGEAGVKIAAFLAALWPKVQIIINPDQRWLTGKQEMELQQTRKIVSLLNKQIQLLAFRSREIGLSIGELSVEECIVTEETWRQCFVVD
ncbi:hypothetical protein FRC12_023334 [Ceratobasidium sp. 428]|nr:hypothetical protein FRC12_023334 [Ceratobasidium sp. 428]